MAKKNKRKIKKKQPQLTPEKKRLFTFMMVLTPVFILLVLELLLRLFNYGGNTRLFITGPEKQISHYYMCNPNIGERYFFMQDTKPAPPKDLFLKKKPENGYRIFVLGGSTTAGYPYHYNLMFPRILGFRLQQAFPDKHIEVVNTAMSAVNSFTLYDLMDEILAQKPDALLIYAGHNEFYGALGVGSLESVGKNPALVYTYLKLLRLKIFLLVRDIVGSLRHGVQKITTGGTDIDPSHTLMDRIVKEQTIPYKSPLYEQGMRQFEKNMRKILAMAQKNNVPVILSELVSNIKDQPPFISVKADTFPTAGKAYKIGKQLEKQGDFEDAKIALTLAKDLDALRFRATEEMNDLVYKIAAEFRTPVVPIKSLFEKHAKNGLIGNELVLEHLHPNMHGYFVMADGFFKTMQRRNFIAADWDSSRIRSMAHHKKYWGITELDTLAANLSIRYLKGSWPFQPRGVPNTSLQNFSPSTPAESLAVRILMDPHFSVVAGHNQLARYFQDQGEYEKAFAEYKAAYYCIPFELDFYEGAVECLVRLDRPTEAMEVLQLSHRYGHTPFTDKWTGQLLALSGKSREAIAFLERARQSTPDDQQLLFNLMKAYEMEGDDLKAEAIREQIGEENPRLSKSQSEQSKDALYTALVKKAMDYVKEKEYLKALSLFENAHQMKETVLTLKWIGLLKLKNGDYRESAQFLSRAAQETPQDFELLYNLCNNYIVLGDKQKAKDALDDMENLRPGFKDPQDLRGRMAQLD